MAIRKFATCMYQLSSSEVSSRFVTAHFRPLGAVITKTLDAGIVETMALRAEELDALCEAWEHHKARKAEAMAFAQAALS